jgi:hypothetical protein
VSITHRLGRGLGAAWMLAGLTMMPAGAQQLNLQSGDNVTVSGSGTTGTYGGQPVSSGTNSYSVSAARGTGLPNNSDPNSTAVTVNASSAFTLQTGGALSATGTLGTGLGAFGGTVTISGGSITAANGLAVDADAINPPSGPVSNISITGGTISGGDGVEVINGATGTLSGGSLSGTNTASGSGIGLYVDTGNGSFSVSGGSVSGANYGLEAEGSSSLPFHTVTVTNGTFTSTTGTGLKAGGALVNISGGNVSGGTGLYSFASSTVTVTGGTFGGGGTAGSATVVAYNGRINMSGGQINAAGPYGLGSESNGVIDLFGSGFTDGQGHAFTGPITSGTGTIVGTLQNGDSLDTNYFVSGATIEFNVAPAPEPSAWVSLGIGALGLCGLGWRARKRKG